MKRHIRIRGSQRDPIKLEKIAEALVVAARAKRAEAMVSAQKPRPVEEKAS